MTELKRKLEAHYRAFNRREFVHPDPLELLYRYTRSEDQEVAGLILACLAYGRVEQILGSAGRVLEAMEAVDALDAQDARLGISYGPRAFLEKASELRIAKSFDRFTHRFTTGRELAAFLVGIKRAIALHGTLEHLFVAGMDPGDETVIPALASFVTALRALAGERCSSLLPSPADGSACKRLNLWLRWMVRRDAVDPGPWSSVSKSKLVVPLDTHMFRISHALGLTRRRSADLSAALEITRGFSGVCPRDPVRYDFSLTRLGIHPGLRGGTLDLITIS